MKSVTWGGPPVSIMCVHIGVEASKSIISQATSIEIRLVERGVCAIIKSCTVILHEVGYSKLPTL
jgi:hypothetical protein